MVSPITVDGFERLFQSDPDPWNYNTSRFEEHKRTVLLRYCGCPPLGRVLELACANGVTTRALAQRALRVTAIDASPAALSLARNHVGGMANVRILEGRLPNDLPQGQYDVIVVSELVYYLSRNAAAGLACALIDVSAPGARVVVLHHHLKFADATVQPELAHRRFVSNLKKRLVPAARCRTSRVSIDVLHRAKR